VAGAPARRQIQQEWDDNRVLPGTDVAGRAEALFRAASSVALSLYKDCDDNDERSTDSAISDINQSFEQQNSTGRHQASSADHYDGRSVGDECLIALHFADRHRNVTILRAWAFYRRWHLPFIPERPRSAARGSSGGRR
jgi:hypothetical protein